MNKNIKLIDECNSNIKMFNEQIAQLQQAIKAQESNILEAKRRLFTEEINGKAFKLRKTSRSKFYELEFTVNIDPKTLEFSGTVKVLNPEIKRNWKWYLLDAAEETDCYIVTRFNQVKKIEDNLYVSTETTVELVDFTIEEMVDAYLAKKLVLVKGN